jgi:hypothetical protein
VDFGCGSSVGTITFNANAVTATATLRSDSPDGTSDEPTGPWATNSELLIKFKTNAIDLADSNSNTMEFAIESGEVRDSVIIHFGDAVTYSYTAAGSQGFVVQTGDGAASSFFVSVAYAADTYYWLRYDFSDAATLKVKVWQDGDAEPVSWQSTLTRQSVDGETDIQQFVIYAAGNDGLVYSIDSISASMIGGEGGAVSRTLAPGDGTTTTWDIGPWLSGTLQVFVDGFRVQPSSTDRTAGTFTLDRAPASGAIVRAEYTPA